MIRMSDNVLAFSTKTGTTQLFELFSDMWNHYLNKYEKKSTVYDQNFSYDDKSAKMNEMLKKEIAKIGLCLFP